MQLLYINRLIEVYTDSGYVLLVNQLSSYNNLFHLDSLYIWDYLNVKSAVFLLNIS